MWGVPDDNINFEAFGPASIKRTSKQTSSPISSRNKNWQITFSRSKKTLIWNSKFNNLLEFAEENGITLDAGCRAGSCGTCICAVKDGNVIYSESPGIDIEDGTCLTCISVPNGDLELEG